MLTPAVFSLPAIVEAPDDPVCVIWRRVHGCWHFFCKAPLSDVERIVSHDQVEMGLSNEDYAVRRG